MSAAQRTQIQGLAGQYQALTLRVNEAENRIGKAQRTLAEIKGKRDAITDPGDSGDLKQAVARARGQGKIEEACRKIERDWEKAAQQAQVDLKKLGLWAGPLEDLETLAIPGDETVARFESEMQDLKTGLCWFL